MFSNLSEAKDIIENKFSINEVHFHGYVTLNGIDNDNNIKPSIAYSLNDSSDDMDLDNIFKEPKKLIHKKNKDNTTVHSKLDKDEILDPNIAIENQDKDKEE